MPVGTTPAAIDVVQLAKEAFLVYLGTQTAIVNWANSRSIQEVTEFGVPVNQKVKSCQYIWSAVPFGQGGGGFHIDLTLQLAAVFRYAHDTEARIDALMKEARAGLAQLQLVLEGQSLGLMQLPLYTDVGPTAPETFQEDEISYGFSYLSMSGTVFQGISDVIVPASTGIFNFGVAGWEQGYAIPD